MSLLSTIWNWLQKFWGLNPDLFLAKFHIFYPFYHRENSCSHWPKFPSESSPLDCADFARVTKSLRNPKLFLANFHFSLSFYHWQKFYFYWPTLLCESPHMKWASSVRVVEALEMTVFIWNNLLLTPKSFRKLIPKYFWDIFSFFAHFTICDTFLLISLFKMLSCRAYCYFRVLIINLI